MAAKYTDEVKKKIIDIYQQEWSVSEIVRQLGIPGEIGRSGIETVLKNAGIYEGINGPNYLKKHTARVKRAMLDKHGVENYGQISRGWGDSNKIPYTKVKSLDDDFAIYRSAVQRLTTKYTNKIEKPTYCDYTGIQFIDDIQERVNPNDPRKRSIDHRIPVILCYLNGETVEKTSSIDNLAFVLKYVNTVKGNTDYYSFLPVAHKIRKIFINEGFPHN